MDTVEFVLFEIGCVVAFLSFMYVGLSGIRFNVVPVATLQDATLTFPRPLSDDELVARVLAVLRSDDEWLDQAMTAFVELVQGYERRVAHGELTRDEATRQTESASVHLQRAILLRRLCLPAEPAPSLEATEEAAS